MGVPKTLENVHLSVCFMHQIQSFKSTFGSFCKNEWLAAFWCHQWYQPNYCLWNFNQIIIK